MRENLLLEVDFESEERRGGAGEREEPLREKVTVMACSDISLNP